MTRIGYIPEPDAVQDEMYMQHQTLPSGTCDVNGFPLNRSERSTQSACYGLESDTGEETGRIGWSGSIAKPRIVLGGKNYGSAAGGFKEQSLLKSVSPVSS